MSWGPAPDSTSPTQAGGDPVTVTTDTVTDHAFDLARARRDTPAAASVAHLNNAGAALPPVQVTEAMIDHLRLEATMGGYEAATAATHRIERTYAAIAGLLGCDADEIAFVENATRAWDMAFYGLRFETGDRILTSRAEYASNVIALLQTAARTGAVIEVIDDDANGQASVEDLQQRIDADAGRIKLVAITHVPTHGGLINPVCAIGAATRAAGIPFLLDACQSVGQLEVNVEQIGCDLLSATGRKFLRGPRGTGFLYVRRSILDRLEPPFLDLHAATWTSAGTYAIRPDARRFESWETNCAGKIALGVAVDYAMSWGLPAIESRVTDLAATLRQRLASVNGVRVHDQGAQRCGIVTFTVAGYPADEIQHRLHDRGINVSVSLVEHARLDLPHRALPDLVRASVHYYNTAHELDLLVEALPKPLSRTRG